jgi:hypothetical protein
MDLDSALHVLGIPRGATQREVDAAYRRAALRAHPDKPGGSLDAFHRVRGAYCVASDPAAAGEPPALTQSSYVVTWMFHAAAAVAASACRAPDVCLLLPVTLDDEIAGRVKKLVIAVMRWDDETSVLVKTQQTLFVPLAERRDEYTFPGLGDDPMVPWLMLMRQVLPGCSTKGRGDVRLRLERLPHATFRVDDVLCDHDLHTEVRVTPLDYYYGTEVRIDHLDGLQPVVIAYSHRVGAVHIEKGRGMPLRSSCNRGDLHVFFELHMPYVPPDRLAAPGVREALELLFSPMDDGEGRVQVAGNMNLTS